MSSKYADMVLKAVGYSAIFPVLLFFAILARFWRSVRSVFSKQRRPKLVWAGVPLYSLVAASRAMRKADYNSICIANDRYSTTNPQDFDHVIKPAIRLPFGLNTIYATLRAAVFFVKMMFTRDILHGFFNGALLGRTPLIDSEYFLWKLSGGKLVLMPYGSDSFVYSQLPDCNWANALRKTYPLTPARDQLIESRLKRFTAMADCVIGCIVHDVCLPRVDIYSVLWYPANLDAKIVLPAGGDILRIAHASNHDQLKGSNELSQAVADLRQEGVEVNLDMISGVPREQVLERFKYADVVVDQLLFGYALTALEAMSLGKPVITGISMSKMYSPFRRHSYLDHAPVIPANPQSIKDILRELAANKNRLREIGNASRRYVEKYHSPQSTVNLFEDIYREFVH